VPVERAVIVDRELPPVAVVYHFIPVPLAARLFTVGILIEQNDCGDAAVGASGAAVTVILTVAKDPVHVAPLVAVRVRVAAPL
jgi:hypothetical protein